MSQFNVKKWPILKNVGKDITGNIKSLYIFGRNADQCIITTNDDTVYSFGSNSNGCLGLGHTTDVQKPTKIDELCGKRVTTIEFSANYEFVLALANSFLVGTVFSWGQNNRGQLGNGNTTAQYKPVTVNLLTENTIIDIKCGYAHSLALTQNGDVFMWGFGLEPVITPKRLMNAPKQKKIVSIDSGLRHSLALTECGQVYFWGDSNYNTNQFSTHSYPFTQSWCLLENLTNVLITKIICGPNHCLILSSDGSVYTFGANSYGQLGDDSASLYSIPPAPTGPYGGLCHHIFNPNDDNDSNHFITYKNNPQKLNLGLKFTDIGAVKYYNISVGLTDSGVCYVWGEIDGLSLANPFRLPYSDAQSVDDVIDIYSKNWTTFKPILFGETSGRIPRRLKTERIRNNFNNNEFSDFAFKVDNKYIYAHKTHLMMVCNHFRNMFAENKWKESNENEMEIKDYSYDVYYAFLKYLYTNTVDIDSKHTIGLLDLANCYLEFELKEICVKLLRNQVSIDNLCDIYASATKYNLEELREYCKKFLFNNNSVSVAGKVLDKYSQLMI